MSPKPVRSRAENLRLTRAINVFQYRLRQALINRVGPTNAGLESLGIPCANGLVAKDENDLAKLKKLNRLRALRLL